jgi:hypothetical protein
VKAKRMGRPPLAKSERKANHLSVRLTRDEYRSCERAAKVARIPLSDWVRGVVLAAASSSSAEGDDTPRTPRSGQP